MINKKIKQILFSNYYLLILLLLTSVFAKADFKPIDFSQNYQYDYINKQINQPHNKVISQLTTLLKKPSTSLSVEKKYFTAFNLSYALFKKHNKETALSQLNKTIELAKAMDSYHLASTLLLRAKTYGILFHKTNIAITDLKQAVLISKTSQYPTILRLQFDLQTAMAQAYNQLAQLTAAKLHNDNALSIAKLLHDNNESIHALIIAGRIAYQQNDFVHAYQFYLKALNLSDNSTPPKRIASIELRLAIAYESQNIYQQALIHAKKAVALYSKLSEEGLQIKSLRVLGNIYLSLGHDVDTALVHFLNALTIAKNINNAAAVGEMQHLIGKSYLLENNIEQAKKYLNAAQIVLTNSKIWFYVGLNTLELAKLARKNNNNKQAISLLKQRVSMQKLQHYPSLIKEINLSLLALYLDEKQFKNAYYLQNKLWQNDEQANQNKTDKNILTFDNKVKLKTLQSNLTTLTNDNRQLKQQNKILLKQFIYTLVSLIFCASLFVYMLVKNKQWQHRYREIIKTSLLTWPAFKNEIVLMATSKNNLGILVNVDNLSKDKEDQHSALDKICQTQLSSTRCQHNQHLWHVCQNSFENIEERINQLLPNNNQNFLSSFWISLDDFPHHISTSSLLIIESVISYLIMQPLLNYQGKLTKITFQSQAFPILLTKNTENLVKNIEQATIQKFIQFESFNIGK